MIVAQELAGVALFAWAVDEIESRNLAIWCGSSVAVLAGGVLNRLSGFRAASLFPGATLGEGMILPAVFTVVFVAGTMYVARQKGTPTQ